MRAPASLQGLDEAPAPGILRFYSFLNPETDFLADVLAGLSAPRKSLPARWRYDAAGLATFDALCRAPEYYLARTERALLQAHLAEAALIIGADPQLIEIGPAAGICSGALIAALRAPLYLHIGVDAAAGKAVAARLSLAHPCLHIIGILADPTAALVLPEFTSVPVRKKAVYLSAAAAGMYTPDELSDILRGARRMVGTGGALIAGIGLKKNRKLLEAAANDAEGCAARLNASLPQRINRELGADFQLSRFHHVALHNELLGCTGMYLESDYAQFVQLQGRRFDFAAGEPVLTGIASQYTSEEFGALAVEAGFTVQATWTDDVHRVAVNMLMAV